MATRDRPVVVSTRVQPSERALIRALSEAEGISVCEAVHRVLMPAVRERLTEVARTPAIGGGRGAPHGTAAGQVS
jgi:hypothetical protein